jgi:hypothetical protein
MRTIYLEPELRVRFPERSADFDEGVEIGAAAALMALGEPTIERWLAPASVEQFRALAARFDYRVAVEPPEAGLQRAMAYSPAARPRLRLVR